jgi:hypothetical protein
VKTATVRKRKKKQKKNYYTVWLTSITYTERGAVGSERKKKLCIPCTCRERERERAIRICKRGTNGRGKNGCLMALGVL